MDVVGKKKTEVVPSFAEYAATAKLRQLAKDPFDLTNKERLTPKRFSQMTAEACEYRFFYGTERVDQETIAALRQLAGEARALEKMERMQNGEITNYLEKVPSSNLPVLHTAVRDFFENPRLAPRAKEAARKAKQETERVRAFVEKIERLNAFSDLVIIGIGGSELGPKAHYAGLHPFQKPQRRAHFICNVDPDDLARVLRDLDLTRTLVCVVSKTGTTLETAANEAYARDRFRKAGLNPEKSFIAVTAEGSAIDGSSAYLETFHLWDWVGGRFSTSSASGALLIAFVCGFAYFEEFLKGANAMDKAALSEDLHTNLPLLAALLGIWNRNFLKYPTLAIVPYSQGLSRYAAHVQQVDMESNGKRIDQQGRDVAFETGPIVFGEPGTNAQHSFYQLIHQGTDICPLEFIGFKQSQYGEDFIYQGTTAQEKLLANLFAQMLALAAGQKTDNPNKTFPGNRPSHLLMGERLTPYSIGALLAFYEHKIAFQGFIWGINSFDQEGVQLGKTVADKILARFKSEREGAPKSGVYPLGDALLKLFELV